MSLITIGQLAARFGLRTSALRYYDEAGLLRPAQRVNGRRLYDEDAVARLGLIRLAQSVGFTLSEIRTLLRAKAEWQTIAAAKVDELDAQIRRLRAMKRMLEAGLRCDCIDISSCGRLAARVMR